MAEKNRPKKRKRTPPRTGNCFEAAVLYILHHAILGPRKDLLLVQGEVGGSGRIEGLRYAHAWIEDGDQVIDESNGNKVRMSRDLYYALGKVYPDFPPFKPNLHKYTVEQVRENVLKYRHYGPWDLKTSTGL